MYQGASQYRRTFWLAISRLLRIADILTARISLWHFKSHTNYASRLLITWILHEASGIDI